jgi:predicted DNA-binding protein (MmcQ/YjbR family)
MFAAVDIQNFDSVNVKNSPEKNIELRENFFSVMPGYHMYKKHWKTIEWNGDMEISQILEMVKESYEIIFDSLPKRIKEALSENIKN